MSSRGSGEPPTPRQRLLEEHLDLVEAEARAVLRQRGLSVQRFLSDAVQDGVEGLADAAERFKAEKGTPLRAYARPFVRGAIIDALNRARRSNVLAVLLRGADHRAADFVLANTIPEEAFESPGAAIAAARKSLAGYLASLNLGYLGAIRQLDPESALAARREHSIGLQVVQEEFGKLPERDQRVLTLRDVDELPWDEVARRLGASKSTVQRWRAQAVQRLGEALRNRGIAAMPPLPDEDET